MDSHSTMTEGGEPEYLSFKEKLALLQKSPSNCGSATGGPSSGKPSSNGSSLDPATTGGSSTGGLPMSYVKIERASYQPPGEPQQQSSTSPHSTETISKHLNDSFPGDVSTHPSRQPPASPPRSSRQPPASPPRSSRQPPASPPRSSRQPPGSPPRSSRHPPASPPHFSHPPLETPPNISRQPPSAPPSLPPKGIDPTEKEEFPPELPPRPVVIPPPPPVNKHPPPYKATSKSLTLEEFAKKYKLPQMVRVTAGVYDAVDDRRTMPNDQELICYFMKKTKVVKAAVDDGYRVHTIPVNSAIKFIPLYKGDSQYSKASWEGEFDNVADFWTMSKLPKALRVMKDISDSQGMTVKEGTLLFNLELKEKKKKRLLKVVDHLNRRLSFFENERVFFSSKRLDLQMFVYEFARFLKFPITVQAMVPADIMDMLRDEATSPDMIIHMNSILQFRSCCEETTLVVNSDIANLRDIKTRMQFIMEVPVDLDIEVECIEFCDEEDTKDMYRAVAESYQAFDLSGMSSENPYAERSQHLLNTQVDETYTDGTELGDIDHIYDYIDMKQMEKSMENTKSLEKASSMDGPTRARDLPLPPTPDKEDLLPGQRIAVPTEPERRRPVNHPTPPRASKSHKMETRKATDQPLPSPPSLGKSPILPLASVPASGRVPTHPLPSPPSVGNSPTHPLPSSEPSGDKSMYSTSPRNTRRRPAPPTPSTTRTEGKIPLPPRGQGTAPQPAVKRPPNPQQVLKEGADPTAAHDQLNPPPPSVQDATRTPQTVLGSPSDSDDEYVEPVEFFNSGMPPVPQATSEPSEPYQPMRIDSTTDGVKPVKESSPVPTEPYEPKPVETGAHVAPVPPSTVVPPVKGNSGGDLQSQENRAYLRQLDHVTILSLLDLLGLPQYRASFASEHIDGDILVDLGIEELKDLGVTSKIHLLRLMKIIEGKTPAKKYLEEGSPYGELPVPKR